MILPKDKSTEINRLGNLFNNMSESYKIFWFKAIVKKIEEGKTSATFDDLINTMVGDAWYMVDEYRLNLGPSDTLEKLVILLSKKSELKSSEKPEKIIEFLENCENKEIISLKKVLTQNVPYRLLAPLFEKKTPGVWDSIKSPMNYINSQENLLYKIEESSGPLNRNIVINSNWSKYILKNLTVIKGWVDFNLITYLQKRNPSVPGIVNKINPPQKRNLEKVKTYWKAVITAGEIRDIYTGKKLDINGLSIDHFVPWSYVAHDELWNLSPTSKSVNSSKNNNLPKWDVYFEFLAKQEYESYKLVNEFDHVRELFEKCKKEHLNNTDILGKLYRPKLELEAFSNELEVIIRPVYESAKNMGFSEWRYNR